MGWCAQRTFSAFFSAPDFRAVFQDLALDIGVCMRPEVLKHKLAARSEPNSEQAWNLSRWPSVLSQPGPHRLFVASRGAWRGYFVLRPDALFTPNECWTPFTLLFDAHSWTELPPTPVKQFRGFTYKVPTTPAADQPDTSSPHIFRPVTVV